MLGSRERGENFQKTKSELEKKMKSSGTPEDKLDEKYFTDYTRFNKRQDERDPLFQDIKNKGRESEDFQSMLKEGIRETKETFQQMKDSVHIAH